MSSRLRIAWAAVALFAAVVVPLRIAEIHQVNKPALTGPAPAGIPRRRHSFQETKDRPMKIKITVGGNDRIAIILPSDCAGLAAELMARATIFERDGHYSTSGWKRAEEGVRIEYTEGGELEPTHPLVEKAQKEASENSSQWYAEYTKNQKLTKELDELKAQLAGIQSVTSCTVTPVESEASTGAVTPLMNDPDVDPFA